ncbi:MAG: hypothetical protein HS113_07125 [Verrucomicrobiales bacterium]|nr:hypothetical protein [Verrucomicrobiales bacterium]
MTQGFAAILRETTDVLRALGARIVAGRRFHSRPRYRVTGNRNPFRVRRALLHSAVLKLKNPVPSLDDHA